MLSSVKERAGYSSSGSCAPLTWAPGCSSKCTIFAVVGWGGVIKAGDNRRLNKLVRKAKHVIGLDLDSLEDGAQDLCHP